MRNVNTALITICLLLVSASPLAGAWTSEPTAPVAPVSTTTGHQAMADPILVDLQGEGSPSKLLPYILDGTITATFADVPAAIVTITAGPGVLVTSPAVIPLPLLKDQPVPFRIALTVLEAGDHLVEVRVNGKPITEHNFESIGGYRRGFVSVPELGAGAFHVNSLPTPDYIPLGLKGPEDLVPKASALGVPLDAVQLEIPTTSLTTQPFAPGALDPADTDDVGGDLVSASDVGVNTHQITVTGCIMHYNEPETQFLLTRWVWIQLWDYDPSGTDDLLWEGFTGYDGCWSSGLIQRADPDGGGYIDVYFVARACSGNIACARDSANNVYAFSTGATTVDASAPTYDFGWWYAFATGAWRVYNYVNNGWYFTNFNSGYDPGVVDVKITPSECTYYTFDDVIHICADGVGDRSPDDVLHEYGHFVEDKAYGDSYWPSPNGSHSLCQDNQHPGLSWMEGWADYYGPRVSNELSFLPGANGDSLYSRPLDGSQFSFSLENRACSTSILGQDDEINVAQAVWDLRDNANDGTDQSTATNQNILDVLRNCNDATYVDYGLTGGPNSAGCYWANNGGTTSCDWVRTSFQNLIDYNAAPTAAMSSGASFAWNRGTISLSGSGGGDWCSPDAEFRISSNNICSTGDYYMGTDTTWFFGYSVNADTTIVPDDASVWFCIRTFDGMEYSPWDISASSNGIDNTVPALTAAGNCSLAGNAPWCRGTVAISYTSSDATSGFASGYPMCSSDSTTIACAAWTSGLQGYHYTWIWGYDNAGNYAQQLYEYYIDSVAPSVSASQSCASPGDNGWCKSNVGITTSASDGGSGLAVGQPTCTRDAVGFACAYTDAGQGTHTFVASALDVAGNSASDTENYKLDTVLPSNTITPNCATPGNPGWCRAASYTYSMATSDATSGVAAGYPVCSLDGTVGACAGTVNTQGAHTLRIDSRDNAGHTRTTTLALGIDSVAPTVGASNTCATPGLAGWCRSSSVGLSLTASDSSPGSGIGSSNCLDNAAPIGCSTSSLGGEGTHTASITATDVAGNSASASTTFKIDSVAPVGVITPNCATPGNPGWCRSPSYTYSMTSTDATSGNAAGYPICRLDGVNTLCAGSVGTEGAHTLALLGRDIAGNAVTNTLAMGIDSIAPTVSLSTSCATPGNAGWCKSNVDVTATGSDASPGSGLAAGNPVCLRDAALSPCGTVTMASEGLHTFSINAVDKAGNSATPASVNLKIDKSQPINTLTTNCAIPGTAAWCRDTSYTYAMSTTDAVSGIVGGYPICRLDGVVSPCSGTVSTLGSHSLSILSRDVAGNTRQTTRILGVDPNAPTTSITTNCANPGSPGWCKSSSYTYSMSASDATSGLGVGYPVCKLDAVTVACSGTVSTPGMHTLKVTATDKAGNSAIQTVYLGIDDAPPTVTITTTCGSPGPGPDDCSAPSFTYGVSYSAPPSGIAPGYPQCTVNSAPAPCSGGANSPGTYVIQATVTDNAGWSTTVTRTVNLI